VLIFSLISFIKKELALDKDKVVEDAEGTSSGSGLPDPL
jgi:hypothetical protein